MEPGSEARPSLTLQPLWQSFEIHLWLECEAIFTLPNVQYLLRLWLLVRQEVRTFEWAMFANAHLCTSLYLNTEALGQL